MSFIDTDDPFSIAAKRIRSSVIRSTPEPQLPIQGKQQPTTYIIEPDLMETQTGKMNLPNDVAFDDAGFAYNTVTGNPVQVIRRPNVLPVIKKPEGGFDWVMPKMLDIAGNVMGNVGGLAGGKVAANAGELVLGSGAVRTAIKTPKITAPFKKVGLTTLDNYLKANNIPFKKDISKSIGSLSSYYYIDTPTGIKKLRVSDHIGGVGEHANFPLGSSSEEAFNKINEFLGTSLTPEKFDNFKNSLKLEIEDNLKEWQDAKASKKYDSYGPYDYDRPINIFKNQLALFSDTRPQVAAATGHALEKQNQPFFSALERTVDNAKIGKADANQWLGYLKNQPGVKQEELGYVLGNLPEGPISKEALAGLVKQNKVQLGEVVKGGKPEILKLDDPRVVDYAKNLAKEDDLDFDKLSINQKNNYLKDSKEWVEENINKAKNATTKYHDYQLPGGENYQEMLLTLPDKQQRLYQWEYFDPKTQTSKQFATKAEAEAAAPDGAVVVPKETQTLNESYKSSHWGEPNILAHVRYNDRNIPDIGKSLHLEEIQSDWHQAGRKQGYKGESDLNKFNELDRQLQDARSDLAQAAIDSSQNSIGMSWQKFLQTKPTQEAKDAALAKIAEYRKTDTRYLEKEAKVKELEKARSRANPAGKVPDAPFKKNWDELAFKRMLHKAANEGYDSVSWTPGEAQAARYDLSKQVEAIRANKNADGTYMIGTQIPGRNMARPTKEMEAIPPEKLADYVGKDLAEKIIKGEGGKADEYGRVYSGLDLKVGGEGMKSFYDKMLVDKANALAKKYGGKVETKNIDVSGGKTLNSRNQDTFPDGVTQVHVLKLTPELRAKAKEGFPLFSSTPIITPVDYDPFNNNKKYKLTPIEGNPFQ